jgi:mercuric ion transport protein
MNQVVTASQRPKSRFAAAGSLAAAVLASSCCIGPLLLVTLGVSGAWIGNLTALEPYQPIFVLITFVFLALGFWQVYFRPAQVCKDDEACARPISGRLVKTVLWVASVLVVSAITIDYWAPLFY